MPPKISNLLKNLPDGTAGEVFETIAEAAGLRIERIVSRGQTTPEGEWYDQAQDEWVLLVAGEARILFEDAGEVTLQPGDHLRIPAGCRHRVTMTAPDRETVWLAVHYPPEGSS